MRTFDGRTDKINKPNDGELSFQYSQQTTLLLHFVLNTQKKFNSKSSSGQMEVLTPPPHGWSQVVHWYWLVRYFFIGKSWEILKHNKIFEIQ